MISCKAIRICQSPFQCKTLILSLPQSVNSSLKKKNLGYGMISMAQSDNLVEDMHSTLGMSLSASEQEIKKTFKSQTLQYHQCPTTNFVYESLSNKKEYQFQEFEDDSFQNFERWLMDVGDDSWENWEEWMGWEGAGTLDYSNHISSTTYKTTNQFKEFKDDLSKNFERLMDIGDDSSQDWEEWMGWEGAGTLDYSNHINSTT